MTALAQRFTHRQYLIFLIALIGVVRILTFAFVLPLDNENLDNLWVALPESVVAGEGYQGCDPNYFFTCTEPQPTAAREPGNVLFYALLFKVFGQEIGVIFIAQVLLDMLTGWFAYQIARRIFQPKWIGLAVVAVWAVYLPAISVTGQYYWSPLATMFMGLFVLSLVWALERRDSYRRILLSGVAFGLLCLTRTPNEFSIMLLIPALLLARRSGWTQRLLYAGAFTAAFVVMLSPWVIRNYIEFKAFIPTTTLNGYNIFRHTQVIEEPDTLWYGNVPDSIIKLQERAGDRLYVGMSEVELNNIFMDEGLKIIAKYPDRYLQLSLSRVADGWFNIRPAQFYEQNILATAFTIIVNGVLWLFAIPALFITLERWLERGWPLLLMLLFSTVIYLPVSIQMHYLIPVAPFLFMFAAYGWHVIRQSRHLWSQSTAVSTS
ncbi:MAG: glycosyltransferase family 39 protein [Anaerolineaceae bacterium]|nr:glycosyltransferase family 39 protein [Anaerolineaceae bacterium]